MHQSQQLQQKKMEDVEMIDENEVERILSRGAYNRRKFDIFEAPEFIQRLNAYREAVVGDNVTFSGQYRAFPKPTVKWFKDEEEILETIRHQLDLSSEREGIVRLVIADVRRKDEGAYKCKVENQEGVASTTGYLSVTGKSPDKSSNNLQARKGTSERVSTPPYLRPIVEQRSMEEKEEKEYQRQPPSPLQEFIDSIRHCAKSMQGAIDYGSLDYLYNSERLKDFDDEDVFSDSEISKSATIDFESSEDEVLTESELSSDQEGAGSIVIERHYFSDVTPEVHICAVDSFVSPSVDLTPSSASIFKDKVNHKRTADVAEMPHCRRNFEENEKSLLEETRQKSSLLIRRNQLALRRSHAIELPDIDHSTISLRLNTDISLVDDINFDYLPDYSRDGEEVSTSVSPISMSTTYSQQHRQGNKCVSNNHEQSLKMFVPANKTNKSRLQNTQTEAIRSCSTTKEDVVNDDVTDDITDSGDNVPSELASTMAAADFDDIFSNMQGDLIEWLDQKYVQFYLVLCVLGMAVALAAEIPPERMVPAIGFISLLSFSQILDKLLQLAKRIP